MFTNIQAVIFDLDGTLVDSLWMWKEIDEEYLNRYGKEYTPEMAKEFQNLGFDGMAKFFHEHLQIPRSIDEIKEDWNRISEYKYRYEVGLKEGVLQILQALKEKGIQMGIATSNNMNNLNALFENIQIQKYFKTIVTQKDVDYDKPAPDIYLEAARRLQVLPKHCLVFEDMPVGIQAGKSAGMRVCAVEDSYSKNLRKEKKSLADHFIEDYIQILGNIAVI